MNDFNEIQVTSAQIAAMLDLSEPRVRQLAQAGCLVRGSKRGQYKLADSLRAYNLHREAETNSPARQRREHREQAEHARFLEKLAIERGDAISIEAFHHAISAIELAGRKSIQSTERTLINTLWPQGKKDLALVNRALDGAEATFCAWMNVAIDMIRRGATADDVRVHLFNSHASPPAGPVGFGTKQTRARRSKKATNEAPAA